MQQVVNTYSPHAPEALRTARLDLVVSNPPQGVAAEVREKISAAQPGGEGSQGSEAGQQNVIEPSNHMAVAPSDPAHEPISLIAQSPSASVAGTLLHSELKQPDAAIRSMLREQHHSTRQSSCKRPLSLRCK